MGLHGLTSYDRAGITNLEHEVRQLRCSKETLRKGSVFLPKWSSTVDRSDDGLRRYARSQAIASRVTGNGTQQRHTILACITAGSRRYGEARD